MLDAQDRIQIVRYRIENAHRTMDEVRSHIENGFYNTAVNRMVSKMAELWLDEQDSNPNKQ